MGLQYLASSVNLECIHIRTPIKCFSEMHAINTNISAAEMDKWNGNNSVVVLIPWCFFY